MLTPLSTPGLRIDVSPGELIEELDPLLCDLLSAHAIPGAALALVRDGEVVLSRGWGLADAATKQPMGAGCRLEAASLAKPLTAYLALQLCAERILGLDTPLASYLPASEPLGARSEDPRWRRITLRHVLSHTSGLSHSDPPVILAPPGEGFRYSLGGFAWLQRVLEHSTGSCFEQLVTERIFQPLGMSQSSFLTPRGPDTWSARGHDDRGRPLPPAKVSQPRAWNSLWTSARDYARFLARISRGGSEGCFDSTTWAAMLEPQVKIHDGLSWTLGWGLQDGRSGPLLWHWGGPRGGRHYVALAPDHQLGLVLLVNGARGAEIWPRVVATAMGGHHPILPWGGSLWWRADRRAELAEVESLQRRHEAFAFSLSRTLGEQVGTALRVEASFTELAPYSECVLMASRFPTCAVRLRLGPGKPDAVLNLPVAALRALLGESNPEIAARPPDAAEHRQLEPIMRRIALDLAAAWELDPSTFEAIDCTTDPRAVALAGANEPIVLLGFRVVPAAATDPAATTGSSAAQPAGQRYQLGFTVGYPLDRL